ncbi:hypothetical protein BHM03_00046992 [Ensete ventricosum]|nr:hypothetical protein BHM03_00046992 [Ensete ventricosum]
MAFWGQNSSRLQVSFHRSNLESVLSYSLCLRPLHFRRRAETCHLELEFDEDNDVVFSVLGQRSVHLCGYYLGACQSYGSFDSEEDEYESDFIDDGDIEMFPSSPHRKSSAEQF